MLDTQAAPDNADAASGLRGRHILYVTHRLPYPPTGGARVRAFHTIRHLARHNKVTVAAPVRDAAEARAAKDLAALGHRVLTAPISRSRAITQALLHAASGRPASKGYFHAAGLAARIRELAEREPIDLALVHCSAVGHYVENLDAGLRVLDFVDMDSCKWRDYSRVTGWPRNLVHAWEGLTLARHERRLAGWFDLSLTATAHEQASLDELAPGTASAVVRNGVDLEYFQPTTTPYDPDRICFIGRMDYFPNEQAMVAFCNEVWPRIRARRPGARLSIVGADPTATVRGLAAHPGVEVTGSVPDVRPYVRRCAASVAPLKLARGTQNKVLEAMAMGVPVIASALAARGVDAVPGEHLLAPDTPDEMAGAIVRVMTDAAYRDRFSRAGRQHIEDRYAWSTALGDLDAILQSHLDPIYAPSAKDE